MNLLLLTSALAAAAEPALRVEVDADAPLDVPALAEMLGDELDVAVVLDGDAPSRVMVRTQGPGTVAIVYIADDGARRERVVELPSEAEESTRTVVLLVSNLARDQVGALGIGGAEADEADEAGADEAGGNHGDGDTIEHADRAAVDERPAAEQVATEGPARAPRDPAQRRFHLGAGVIGGAAPVGEAVEPFFIWGVETGARVTENFQLGVARASLGAGYASTGGGVLQVHGTPYAELSGWVGARLEPFGRVGVAIRGKEARGASDDWFEAAPYVGGGARFYPTRYLAIGFEVGVNLVATDVFTLGGDAIPRWSTLGSTGVSTTFHF